MCILVYVCVCSYTWNQKNKTNRVRTFLHPHKFRGLLEGSFYWYGYNGVVRFTSVKSHPGQDGLKCFSRINWGSSYPLRLNIEGLGLGIYFC